LPGAPGALQASSEVKMKTKNEEIRQEFNLKPKRLRDEKGEEKSQKINQWPGVALELGMKKVPKNKKKKTGKPKT